MVVLVAGTICTEWMRGSSRDCAGNSTRARRTNLPDPADGGGASALEGFQAALDVVRPGDGVGIEPNDGPSGGGIDGAVQGCGDDALRVVHNPYGDLGVLHRKPLGRLAGPVGRYSVRDYSPDPVDRELLPGYRLQEAADPAEFVVAGNDDGGGRGYLEGSPLSFRAQKAPFPCRTAIGVRSRISMSNHRE